MNSDKLANDLSPRNEALKPSSVSPKRVEKQQQALSMENGWLNDRPFKDELPQGELERQDSSRAESDSPFWWDGDDDDFGDDNVEGVKGGREQKKKVHSLEEIKYTRYLRMKSPNHWLPKMGKVPENLLSSSIIVGHTKLPYESIIADDEEEDEDVFEDEQNGLEGKEKDENNDGVEQSNTADNEENGCDN